MEKLGFGLDIDLATSDQKQVDHLLLQRCAKHLIHICQCRAANCRFPSCQRMKRVIQHAKSCKLRTNDACQTCRRLIALCYYHAKHCQVAKCTVSFCSSVKNKMKLQDRQQVALILARCIATLQNCRKSASVLQTSPDNSNSSNQPSPGAGPHSSPDPPQSAIGMEPSTAPPVALQAVQQVQPVAAGETDPHMVAASVNQ